MRRCPRLTQIIAAAIVLAACGSTSSSSDSEPASVAPDTQSAAPTETTQPQDLAPATPPGIDATLTTDSPATATSSPASSSSQLQPVQSDQPAIWPAAGVVFTAPEEAAASFVTDVLGVEPVLGDFLAGDSRSGEVQVFSPGEVEGADLLERGVLTMRIAGPNDGWFVIAAHSSGITIASPNSLDRVVAGPLAVNGEGRGFEGTLVVSAFRAGDAGDVLDQVITRGGPFAEVESFDVTLDLSSGVPGDVIAVIVRGDTGLDGDPGEFAALPIVVDATLPATS